MKGSKKILVVIVAIISVLLIFSWIIKLNVKKETITMATKKEIIANSTTEDKYTLSIEIEPEGAGEVTGAGSYAEGEEVTITATAKEGYRFIGWWTIEVDSDGKEVSRARWTDEETITFEMPSVDSKIAAIFVKDNNESPDPESDPEKDPEKDPESDPEKDPEKDPESDPEKDPEKDPESDPKEDSNKDLDKDKSGNKVDETAKKDKTLPKAGIIQTLTIFTILASISLVVSYLTYKKYKDI